jgi:membrane-bound lytic murein transglycosylase D
MIKRTIVALGAFFIFTLAYAGTVAGRHLELNATYSDTAANKDSAGVVHDPKQDFKDLFISSTSSTGVSMAQLNPLAISFVEDYIEKNTKNLEELKDWGKPYFDIMDEILVQHGIPKELKYLAVVESELKTSARSWVGAVGPWQLMPATAKGLGLKVGKGKDERKDFVKSTHAASKYLNSLYDIYGDWLLVIAAYNCGAGTVNTAIKKSKSKDFWTLQRFLPTESKNHVKKFIATHYMMEGQGGIATLTKAEASNLAVSVGLSAEDLGTSKTQAISGRYNAAIIAKHLTMDVSVFNKLNPGFDRSIASNGNYELRLPTEKMDLFLAKKPDILNESMQLLLGSN